MANQFQVYELHERGLTATEIAERLECMPEYVRATLRRYRAKIALRAQGSTVRERRHPVQRVS